MKRNKQMDETDQFSMDELKQLYNAFSKETLIDIVMNCNAKIYKLERIVEEYRKLMN